MSCIFCKIISQEIPKELDYEDSDVVVFSDIRPIKPVHLLIVPKIHITDYMELSNDCLTLKVRDVIKKMVEKFDLDGKGYRVIINGGGAQAIDHLHFHLVGPMGKAADL